MLYYYVDSCPTFLIHSTERDQILDNEEVNKYRQWYNIDDSKYAMLHTSASNATSNSSRSVIIEDVNRFDDIVYPWINMF